MQTQTQLERQVEVFTTNSFGSLFTRFTRKFFNFLIAFSLLLSLSFTPAMPLAQAQVQPEGTVPRPVETGRLNTSVAQPATLNFTQIAAGYEHTCALTAGGGVMCWGDDWYGELSGWSGYGNTGFAGTPVSVWGLSSGVTALAAGYHHTCALTTSGGVKCWGANDFGQLGDGTTTVGNGPVDVSGLTSGVTALTAGGNHTCALTASSVKCWGGGQSTPVDVSGLVSGVTALAAGGSHTCALISGGVKCWGDNFYGQLGDGTTTSSSTPVDVIGLGSGVIALATGGSHTCALIATGGIKCWGYNYYSQLGDGTTTDSSTPVDVSGLSSGVVALTAGGRHTCALTASGGLKCWGRNSYGQLGDGTTTRRSTPVDVSDLGSGVTTLAAGYDHTCALTTGGGMKCWGWNEYGQLGDGTPNSYNMPMDVNGLESGVTALAANDFNTCALTASGGVKCWGDFYPPAPVPVDVNGLSSGVTALAAGGSHTCALTVSGGVKCWGDNFYGQLGDGTTNSSYYTPVDVSGLSSGVVALAAGGNHTCALTTGGGVKCWGDSQKTPIDMSGLASGVIALAAGGSHTCAVLTGGGVKCWGNNYYGQLGDGTTTTQYTPVDVIGLGSGVTALTAGGRHTCALTIGGGLKCWGHNYLGQLGNGTTTNSSTPVDVSGLGSGVTALVAGDSHTCAITASGGAKCWGYGTYGQLGNGAPSTRRSTPVDVSGLGSGVMALAAGKLHTCASVGAGRAKCWGSDYYSVLGVGRVIRRLTPVDVVGSTPARVALNYPTGQPGSFFTVTGENFPISSTLTIMLNSALLTTTLSVNATGGVIFFINTAGANAGDYILQASANFSLTSNMALTASSTVSTTFKLEPTAPLRVQEGGGQTLVVPAGLVGHKVYLPLVMR